MMRNAPLAPGTVVAAAGPLWVHKPWASAPAWTASRKKLLESASTGRRGGLAAAEGSSPACLGSPLNLLGKRPFYSPKINPAPHSDDDIALSSPRAFSET